MPNPSSPPSSPPSAASAAPDGPASGERLLAEVIEHSSQRPQRADGIAIGVFMGLDADGSPLVSVSKWGIARIRARSIAAIDSSHNGQSVALGFDNGDPLRPIILGLMLAQPAARPAPEVVLDGERVQLEAAHEIELRCGEAAIILSADGRIELRGTYITSYASATQRILGGSVYVN